MTAKNILDTIGNTPIVELSNTDTGLCRLFLKLENQNPGGSIKDRVGLSMINEAEKQGKIKPGDCIVEATAGNTGLGLALVARAKGYKLVLVIPDKMSLEKINHLKALGVEIIMTRSDVVKGHPDYYQDLAERIAQERNAYYINQFENPANPLAHETSTAPEIWEQMEHRVDAIVVGVGSSGTITGLTRFFKKVAPQTEFVLADPEGSILADYINKGILRKYSGSWLVEGIGEDFIPSIADFSLTRKAYSISDQESFQTVHSLLRNEGVLAGSSTGTLLSAAIRYCKEQPIPKRVVTIACDSGNKYLSKMYNRSWLEEHNIKLFE
jgi:cystathionine beta-synthase